MIYLIFIITLEVGVIALFYSWGRSHLERLNPFPKLPWSKGQRGTRVATSRPWFQVLTAPSVSWHLDPSCPEHHAMTLVSALPLKDYWQIYRKPVHSYFFPPTSR